MLEDLKRLIELQHVDLRLREVTHQIGQFPAQLAALDSGEAGLKQLAAAAKAARTSYVAAAEAQSAARRKGATRLDRAVMNILITRFNGA